MSDLKIKSLPSAEPEKRTEKRTETHACDLISRQAAIEETWKEPSYTDPINVLTEVRDRIKALPSAQPEIVRCKDCKYADDDGVCQNSIGLAIQDDDDFCSRAERRADERSD